MQIFVFKYFFRYMKHIKLFESYKADRKKEILDLAWHNAKIGDVLDESDIYQYVQELHGNDDFIEGDLGDRK